MDNIPEHLKNDPNAPYNFPEPNDDPIVVRTDTDEVEAEIEWLDNTVEEDFNRKMDEFTNQ